MPKLILTEICDECDVERPTKLCATCKGAYCVKCMPAHTRQHAFYDEDNAVCEQINEIIRDGVGD